MYLQSICVDQPAEVVSAGQEEQSVQTASWQRDYYDAYMDTLKVPTVLTLHM